MTQAWIFAAQEDSDKARQYYTFAALYALPLLTNGFNQDAFSIAAVLACAAHVQVQILNWLPDLLAFDLLHFNWPVRKQRRFNLAGEASQ